MSGSSARGAGRGADGRAGASGRAGANGRAGSSGGAGASGKAVAGRRAGGRAGTTPKFTFATGSGSGPYKWLARQGLAELFIITSINSEGSLSPSADATRRRLVIPLLNIRRMSASISLSLLPFSMY